MTSCVSGLGSKLNSPSRNQSAFFAAKYKLALLVVKYDLVFSLPVVPFSALSSRLHFMEKPKWASDHNLEVCGQYYQGFVDDYKAVLSQHCMATVTTYGVKSRTNASVGTDQEKRMRLEIPYKHLR